MDVASILVPALTITAIIAFVTLFIRLERSRRALADLQQQIVRLRAEAGQINAEKQNLNREMTESRQELDRLRRQLAQASSAMAARDEELDDTREQAREAGRTKSLFVANMSHELRTPLNGILGLTRNLLDSSLTSQQRGEVELIQVAGEDLVRIVNDVLDLSKLEAGKLTLERVPFDFAEVLEGAFSLLYPQAERKHLAYALAYSHRMHRKYVGDPFRLRQVILNLLSNAIKFTQSGAVNLKAEEGAMRAGALWIRLEVEDTGIGIEPDKLRRIFDEFEQADLSTTRKFGGTGLGLSLSKRIVDLMGGEIDVESVPGQGSRFVVQIPLVPIDQQVGIAEDAGSLDGLRIALLARHSNPIRAMMKILESFPGLKILRFDGTEELGRILEEGAKEAAPIDAVISEEGSTSFPPAAAQLVLQRAPGRTALHVVLNADSASHGEATPGFGKTIFLQAPLLPSRVAGLLQQLRKSPVGPLFESAGLTAFDIYRDAAQSSLRPLRAIVAHENPVELRLLEVMLQKLKIPYHSASGETELLAELGAGDFGAVLLHGRLLQAPVASALLASVKDRGLPLRLAVVGDAQDESLQQLAGQCAVFAQFQASPRLSQLRDLFHA